MTSRPAIAVLLVGALLAVAGCGSHAKTTGSSSASGTPADAAFKRAFMAQLAPLRSVGFQLSVAMAKAPSQSDAQVRKVFANLATLTAPVVTGLGTLRAPPRFQSDVAAMRHYLSRAQRDLRAVSQTAAAHQASKLKRAFARLQSDSAAVKAADQRVSIGLGGVAG